MELSIPALCKLITGNQLTVVKCSSLDLTHSVSVCLNSCIICVSVCVHRSLLSLCSSFLSLGSPDSCWKSHTNQLTVIALFTTPRHKRGRKESKQTPITVRHEEVEQSCLGALCDYERLATLTDQTRGSAELCPRGGYEY